MDPAVALLLSAYRYTYSFDPQRLQTFLKHCRDLGPAFTILQFVRIAASCGIVPPDKSHSFETGAAPSVTFCPGDFCIIDPNTKRPRMLLHRTRLVSHLELRLFISLRH